MPLIQTVSRQEEQRHTEISANDWSSHSAILVHGDTWFKSHKSPFHSYRKDGAYVDLYDGLQESQVQVRFVYRSTLCDVFLVVLKKKKKLKI